MESYKNPIHLFQIKAERLRNLDAKEIRRIRKEWLAEIELSETGFIEHQGQYLSKHEIIALSEALAAEEHLPFYLEMTKWPGLEHFLQTGNFGFYYSSESRNILHFPFPEKLGPMFAAKYGKHLYQAYLRRDTKQLLALNRQSEYIPPQWHKACFRLTKQLLHQEKSAIQELIRQRDFKIKPSDPTPLVNRQTARCVKLLPDYFKQTKSWHLYVREKCVKVNRKANIFVFKYILWLIFVAIASIGLMFLGIYALAVS